MYWKDIGYLLHKANFSENSILIETFTLEHGKYTGIVYGGNSRKQKRFFQIGNKILLNCKSKNENKMTYFNIELIKPISPNLFDDKKKTICILAASTLLKILLPERQLYKKLYYSFENLLNTLDSKDWITNYIYWELFLIKELGFEIDFPNELNLKKKIINNISINGKSFKIPELIFSNKKNIKFNNQIIEALNFNKNIIMENFIIPNRLRFPISRNILQKYYS